MTTPTESPPTGLVVAMEAELADIERRLPVAKREASRLARKIETEGRAAERWSTRATAAMRAGEDVVGNDALARGRACDRALRALRRDLAAKTDALRGLGAALSAVTFRLEQARATLAVARRTSVAPALASLPALTAAFKPLAKTSLAAAKKPLAKVVGPLAPASARARESASLRERRTKR